MTDWIRIDYNEPSTWPPEGSRIEGLRWFGAPDEWWHVTDAVVTYVNLPGFALNDQRVVGFGLGAATWHVVPTPPDLPDPSRGPDWWRPLEDPRCLT